VTPSVLVGDALNVEGEIFSNISVEAVHVQSVQVEDVQANDLAKKPRVDPHSITPNLRIVGSWSDALTNLDYIQHPSSWCGTTSFNITIDAVIHPQVAHDFEKVCLEGL
ncbi:DUF4283 domain protein, partial [Trifolium medium]|nr:DUF4283 domain protein [Trifolium medium]